MRVSEFVRDNVDSHDLIDLVGFIDGLVEATGAELENLHADGATLVVGGKKLRLRGSTFGDYEKSMGTSKVGPKGVTLHESADRARLAISGYGLASQLARQLTGSAPGDEFNGRGSAYRSNMAAVKAAGF